MLCSFFFSLYFFGFVLADVLFGSTVTTHDAVRLRESKVAVIVTVPGEIPVTTPREFTVATLTSELSKTGFSAEVFGLIMVSSRIFRETGTETSFLINLILTSFGETRTRHLRVRTTFFLFLTVTVMTEEPTARADTLAYLAFGKSVFTVAIEGFEEVNFL